MWGIKYVIENKLQNSSDYNNNTRFTLENLVGKNQPSIIDLLLAGQRYQEHLSCSLTSLLIPKSRLTLTCKCSFLVIEKNNSWAIFFNQEGRYWAMVVMVGPFGPPLGVLWLNGIVDCPFIGVFNLGVGVWGP